MPSFVDRTEEVQEYLRERFGIDSLPGRALEKGGAIWLTTAVFVPEGVKVHSLGLRLLHRTPGGGRPTSFALSFLGERVRKARVEVSREELERLLLGQAVPRGDAPEGYVAIVYRNDVIGCGRVKGGRLAAEISRARRQELLAALRWEG